MSVVGYREYMEKYKHWLNSGYYEDLKEELLSIKDDEKEIEDRFCKELEFGTAGLRGIIGAGTNRMNIYTVGRAANALALCLKAKGVQNYGVVIAYDSRNKSYEFAKHTAKVLATQGVLVYLFDELRPVPELSFAVRYLKAMAGIVITASHNPKEYNGFKVYGEGGSQILGEQVNRMAREWKEIGTYDLIRTISLEDAKERGLLKIIGKEIDDKYIERIKLECINSDVIKRANNFKVVYTPIHGTGNKLVRRVLGEVGFKNVLVVKEQELPDPEFSTVNVPNPEDINALSMGIELAKKENADLVIGTDPDCDRVGVAVKSPDGEYVGLTGNQIGCLLLDYIATQKNKKHQMPSPAIMAKSIVTTKMANKIAKSFDIDVKETLTGFKYIGREINNSHMYANVSFTDERDVKNFLIGFEESYGYLVGTAARDKDGVVSSMVIAEMAAYYEEQGMTLYDAMQELYKKYGYYLEGVKSYTLQGVEGRKKIKYAMDYLRNGFNKDEFIKKLPILIKKDYYINKEYRIKENRDTKIDFIVRENVLYYELGNDEWFCIRPSGTEPKIKLYFGVCGDSYEQSKKRLEELKKSVVEEVETLLNAKE